MIMGARAAIVKAPAGTSSIFQQLVGMAAIVFYLMSTMIILSTAYEYSEASAKESTYVLPGPTNMDVCMICAPKGASTVTCDAIELLPQGTTVQIICKELGEDHAIWYHVCAVAGGRAGACGYLPESVIQCKVKGCHAPPCC
ncbi:unnamed protein product [Sphagnum jensenii]|uniref:SH3 domain-containing protein n=1 Tax=Sphagnum jensenii TaxID=128206 RepID=A0ABP0W9X4_9BRYO